MKRWGIATGILLLIGLAIYSGMRNRGVILVTPATVTRGLFIREVSGTGSIEARIYTLTFSGIGPIKQVNVREGDMVRAGTVLASLDTEKIRSELQALREDLKAKERESQAATQRAESDIRALQADIEETQRKLTLTRKLFDAGAAARDEVRTLERRHSDLGGQLATARAEFASRLQTLRAARASMLAQQKGLEKALDDSTIVAPVKGVIAELTLRTGETSSGARVKLVEENTIKVIAQISEGESAEIDIGMPATIELDSAPEHRLKAIVYRLGVTGSIKGEGGSATLPVELRFDDGDAARLARPNFTVTARIVSKRLPDRTLLPLEALMEEETNGKKRWFVWLLDKKIMTVSKKYLSVNERNLTQAAVEGLASGAQVVSLPPDNLKPGSRVRIQPAKPVGGN